MYRFLPSSASGFGLSPAAERSDRPEEQIVIDCADSAEVSEEPSREMLFPITIYLLWMHFFALTLTRVNILALQVRISTASMQPRI